MKEKFLMKNKLLIITLLVLFSLIGSTAFSQGAYIKLGGGYGMSLASQDLYNASTVATGWDEKYGSFGEGIGFGLGFGYNINSNFALELAGSYILGRKFEQALTTTTTKYYGNTITIQPSVVIKAPMKDVIPYTRFGMVIGIPTLFSEATSTLVSGTDKYKESGGVALGVQGAVGCNFKVSKKLAIFAEIFGIGMNYAPSQSENTETYTGGTIHPLVTYGETGSYATANTEVTPRRSLSSFGLNVGLTMTFGK
jgi:hypothetical protein